MPSAASKFCTNLREELWTPLPPVCRYIAVGVLALGLVIIMPSVLIGVSYADAPTESYCLKMNVHTREVEKKVEASSGRIYTGARLLPTPAPAPPERRPPRPRA